MKENVEQMIKSIDLFMALHISKLMERNIPKIRSIFLEANNQSNSRKNKSRVVSKRAMFWSHCYSWCPSQTCSLLLRWQLFRRFKRLSWDIESGTRNLYMILANIFEVYIYTGRKLIYSHHGNIIFFDKH